MSSSRRRRQQQQKLTFEPVSEHSSPAGQGLSPARVRFQSPKDGSPSRRSTQLSRMARSKKSKQQTLESSLGKGKIKKQSEPHTGEDLHVSLGDGVKVRQRQPPSPPTSSFMSKSIKAPLRIVDSDSETPVEEDGGLDDTDGEGPLRHEITRRRLSRPKMRSDVSVITLDDSDDDKINVHSSQSLPNQAAADDDSDTPLVTPRSSARQNGRRVVLEELEEDDADEEVEIQSPAKKRRLNRNARQTSLSDRQATPESQDTTPRQSSARRMRSSARIGRHRSEKEKKMELLRRRRAGEKDLTMSDLETSEEDIQEDQGGLYDTDSEHQALEVFYDESEPEPVALAEKSKKKKKKKKDSEKRSENEIRDAGDSDGSLEGFIDEDDDTIGVPDEALYQMPLEFTRASRKPLRAHFKDAIEWLVHRRINPSFEKDDEVYRTAWTRLNDEVMGLANSKFVSSAWRPEFYRALRARPYIEQAELGVGHLATEVEKCQACGRSNHPSTWAINFMGKPYDSWTLDELEDSSDSDSDDAEGHLDRDTHGNILPPEDKQFFVGTVCNSNAETAHNLLHWKPALRDWVDNFLKKEGWLAVEKLAEREKMKAKKRRKLADKIVEDWDQRDIIKHLYGDFKQNIELAQAKDTTQSSRGGRRYAR